MCIISKSICPVLHLKIYFFFTNVNGKTFVNINWQKYTECSTKLLLLTPAKYKGVFTNKPQNKNGDTDMLDVEN